MKFPYTIPFFLLIFLLGVTQSCTSLKIHPTEKAPLPAYPAIKMMVISDTHLFYPELATPNSTSFKEFFFNDIKLVAESPALLERALTQVEKEKPDFLLICGDLTKDGEKINHERFRDRLIKLKASGVQTYVIPGNHDILNPHAVRFTNTGIEKISSITMLEFAQIYSDFGYSQAIQRDPASLSYVVEPVPGLWLIGIDTVKWESNITNSKPTTSGRLRQETANWLSEVFNQAAKKGKAILLSQHHGILEHYRGQRQYMQDYLVDEDQKIARFYAENGVRFVFTGHHHAQDITGQRWPNGAWLFDIETGSLVTPPIPVRSITLGPSGMEVHSTFHDDPITTQKIAAGMSRLSYYLMRKRIWMGDEESRVISQQISDAMMAHYYGDERFTGIEKIKTRGLSLTGSLAIALRKDLIESFWVDLEPADNTIQINPEGFSKTIQLGRQIDLVP